MAMSRYFVGWRTISQPDWSASLPEIASRCLNFLSQKTSSSSSMIFGASAIVQPCILCQNTPNSSTSQLVAFPPGDCIRPIGLDFACRGYEWMNTARSGKMRCHAMSNCRFCGLVVCVACATNRRCLVQIFTGLGFEGFCISYRKIGDIPTIVYVGKYRKGSTKSGKDVHIPTQLKGMFECFSEVPIFFWLLIV